MGELVLLLIAADCRVYNIVAHGPLAMHVATGSIASRVPDGAPCLCHQGYDGKPLWEQIGTGRACWPEKK